MCAVARISWANSTFGPLRAGARVGRNALLVCALVSTACQKDGTPERDLALAQPEAAPEPAAPHAAEDQASPMAPAPADDAAAPSSGEPTAQAKRKPPPNAKLRTIHPLSPTRPDCLEMVSYCTGKPRRCTSAPIHVACGEEAEVASRKEWLRCVCP